jgi:hypothetical protein
MNNPWEKLHRPNRDVNVLRVSESHPLSMFWGMDIQGRYLFLYEVQHNDNPDKKKLPKLEGVLVTIVYNDNRSRLVLLLNDKSNWELFYSLCLDLIRATSDLQEGVIPFTVLIRRLSRWQAFLKKKNQNLLTKEEIKGLIGELLFLKEQVSRAYGWGQAIMFWKGPEGASQDFSIHDSVFEVKCQSGGSKPSIKISSAEQLTPQVPKGFLVVYKIVTAELADSTSFSLNELVSRIQKNMENESADSCDRFEELLGLAGYIPREEYDEPRYKQIDLVCYELREGFPRILLSEIASGIEYVSYHVKLDACQPFITKLALLEDNHESARIL